MVLLKPLQYWYLKFFCEHICLKNCNINLTVFLIIKCILTKTRVMNSLIHRLYFISTFMLTLVVGKQVSRRFDFQVTSIQNQIFRYTPALLNTNYTQLLLVRVSAKSLPLLVSLLSAVKKPLKRP